MTTQLEIFAPLSCPTYIVSIQPSLTVLTVKKASEPNEDQESDVEIDISHTDIPQLDSNLEACNQYASASTISLSQLTALMEKETKQRAKEGEQNTHNIWNI